MNNSKTSLVRQIVFLVVGLLSGISLVFLINYFKNDPFSTSILSPFVEKITPELPLNKYRITSLAKYNFQSSPIILENLMAEYPEYSSYQFSYTTLGKRMTGQANLPKSFDADTPVIVMVRGYVPPEIYTSGVGTKSAAAVLAENGYLTLAPDFFGYGESDPDFEDSWEGRFVKPLNVVELIKSVESNSLQYSPDLGGAEIPHSSSQIGIWAHSNGGQIALTSLEILQQPIPTTLWAPVTVPFPYSVLFYSDESQDEGKASRAWVSIFEKDYDVFDFSLTQHIDLLRGPLQIHHGITDDAALIAWSREFVDKLQAENTRRAEMLADEEASPTAETTPEQPKLDPIEFEYFEYPDTDHNMKPNWNKVIQRDLDFFKQNL